MSDSAHRTPCTDERAAADGRYRRLGWYPIVVVGLGMVAFVVIKTGRDALFFDRPEGIAQLPLTMLAITAAQMVAAMVHLEAIGRFGARRTRVGVFIVTALVLAGFAWLPDPPGRWPLGALFVLVPTLFAAVFAGAWLLAGDLLEGAEHDTMRRVFTRIGAGSTLGGLVGGLLARAASAVMAPRWLVGSGAALTGSLSLLAHWAHRARPIDAPAAFETEAPNAYRDAPPGPLESSSPPSGWRAQLGNPLVQSLMAIAALAAFAGLYIEFQFYAAVTLSGRSSPQFFSLFYLLLNLAAFVLQLLAAPLIQARYGVVGALLVMPIALLGTTSAVTVVGTLLMQAILRVAEGGLKASIHRSAWEQAFLPVAGKERGQAKVLVDGIAARSAEIVGALALFLWVSFRGVANIDLTWTSVAILATACGWVLLTRRLRSVGPIEPAECAVRLADACPVTSALGPGQRR